MTGTISRWESCTTRQRTKPVASNTCSAPSRSNPDNAPALNYLGYTWAEQGIRLDEAESLILRALEISPNDGYYIDSLGWVYYQRGEYEEAIEQLERAMDLASDDATIAEHLGDAYRMIEKPTRGPARLPGRAESIKGGRASRTDSLEDRGRSGGCEDLGVVLVRGPLALLSALALAACAARPVPPPALPVKLPSVEELARALTARTHGSRQPCARWSACSTQDRMQPVALSSSCLWPGPTVCGLRCCRLLGPPMSSRPAQARWPPTLGGEATVYRGPATVGNVERYLNVELPVPTAVDLLLGTPPIEPSRLRCGDGGRCPHQALPTG